ncbi:MAG TPA: hypothetical protein VNO31_06440 [Umezawaea sp.]|nr:hypothetical protein [Umezawaea sp.]
MIFITVTLFTAGLLIIRVILPVMFIEPPDSIKDVITTVGILANAGVGALFGLLGGKV